MGSNISGVTRNFILSRLGPDELRLIEPHLQKLDLPVRKMLEPRQRQIDNVYFIESGFASVVAFDGEKNPIEVGLIGREGMSGLSVILGHERPDNDTYMQAGGDGWRLKVSDLKHAIDQSPSLHHALLRYANSFVNQMTRTVVANGRNTIEERLARWLLMADDRLDGNELQFTQEFLAIMLSVTRPGVTVAIGELERKGLIARKRGIISIIEREGLKANSNGTYIPADYE